MTHTSETQRFDLLTLAGKAPMMQVLQGLRQELLHPTEVTGVPAYSVQIGHFVVAHAVGLMRLHSTSEVRAAAKAISVELKFMRDEGLDSEHQHTYRDLRAAGALLTVASSMSSPGAELPLLLADAQARAICHTLLSVDGNDLTIAQLAEALDMEQTRLRHELALLNMHMLIEFVGGCVYPGVRAQEAHVRELLGLKPWPQQTPDSKLGLPVVGQRLDLLGMRGAPLDHKLEAIKQLASGQREVDAATLLALADLLYDDAVSLVRLGTHKEVCGAAVALSLNLCKGPISQMADSYPLLYIAISNCSTVLSAANSPSSKAAELMVLRSWAPHAAQTVRLVAASDEHDDVMDARAAAPLVSELVDQLGVEVSYANLMLANMEAAALVERIGWPEGPRVHLLPRARQEHVRLLVGLQPAVEVSP